MWRTKNTAKALESRALISHIDLAHPVPELSMALLVGGKSPLTTRKLAKAIDSFLASQTGWFIGALIVRSIRAKASPTTRIKVYLISFQHCFDGPNESIFCFKKENEKYIQLKSS